MKAIDIVNECETGKVADMLFVIKKSFIESNRQNELSDWYHYAIEDNMKHFKERIINKYASLTLDHDRKGKGNYDSNSRQVRNRIMNI